MLQFRLYLLTTFHAMIGNETVAISYSIKARALMAYLAIESQKRAVPRNELIDLLWPGYERKSALQNLRTTLFSLQQAVRPLTIIQATRKSIRLDTVSSAFWCDVFAFEEQTDLLDERIAFLNGIVLEDAPDFTAWKEAQRARLQQVADQRSSSPRLGAAQVGSIGIPTPVKLIGREQELTQLKGWLAQEECRLIGIYGMGGQGKTGLAASVMHMLAQNSRFDFLIWHSLVNAPTLDEVLVDCIQTISATVSADLPTNPEQKISILLKLLSQHSSLIVLDNLESILAPGDHRSRFRPGYEAYAQLIERLSFAAHPSCILLTSREKPLLLTRFVQISHQIHSLDLQGLTVQAGSAVLRWQGIQAADASLAAISQQYSGNPLALLLAASTIDSIFSGCVEQFLARDSAVFGDIRYVLDEQFKRLSLPERNLMIQLAIEREPVDLATLQTTQRIQQRSVAALDVLLALKRRLLVETTASTEPWLANNQQFSLQNVVLEYVTERIIDQAITELDTEALELLRTHLLLHAQATESVRESQLRLIMQPIVDRLNALWGEWQFHSLLRNLVTQLRGQKRGWVGHAATNLLHLMIAGGEGSDGNGLAGADFSRLAVRNAYLRGVVLRDVNFASADLTSSVFTDSMTVIRSVTIDPHSRYYAAGTQDGRIWLWNTSDQTIAQTIDIHTENVWSIDFSPNSLYLASTSSDGTLYIWNVQQHVLHKQLQTGGGRIRSLMFSADSRYLASGSTQGAVCIWDIQTGQLHKTLSHHLSHVELVAYGADDAYLAYTDALNHLYLWDFDQEQLLWQTQMGDARVESLAFHPLSHLLITSMRNGQIQVYDVATGALQLRIADNIGTIFKVVFSPDGASIVGACVDGRIRLWDTTTGQHKQTLLGHQGLVHDLAYSADGKTLISGGSDQLLCVWKMPRGRKIRQLTGYQKSIEQIVRSPNGQRFATGSTDHYIRIWDSRSWKLVKQWHAHNGRINQLAFSPDGSLVASSSRDRSVRIWEVESTKLIRSLWGHEMGVESVVFHPTEPLLASGGHDLTIRLWHMPTGREVAVKTAHTLWVHRVAFSPDGTILVSASGDKTVQFWSLVNQTVLQSIGVFHIPEQSTVFGPSVDFHPIEPLVACSTNSAIYLINSISHELKHTIEFQANWISDMRFSPSGHLLGACGFYNGVIQVWDVHNQQVRFSGNNGRQISRFEFSADGRFVCCATDGYIDIWDIQQGELVNSIPFAGPYQGMNIHNARGLSQSQQLSLLSLGAIRS